MINLLEKWKNLIRNEIQKILLDSEIFIFGSRSKRNNSDYSDVDIAVKSTKKIDEKILSLIKFNIEETEIPYKIDIIDLNNVSEEFLSEIEKDLIKI